MKIAFVLASLLFCSLLFAESELVLLSDLNELDSCDEFVLAEPFAFPFDEMISIRPASDSFSFFAVLPGEDASEKDISFFAEEILVESLSEGGEQSLSFGEDFPLSDSSAISVRRKSKGEFSFKCAEISPEGVELKDISAEKVSLSVFEVLVKPKILASDPEISSRSSAESFDIYLEKAELPELPLLLFNFVPNPRQPVPDPLAGHGFRLSAKESVLLFYSDQPKNFAVFVPDFAESSFERGGEKFEVKFRLLDFSNGMAKFNVSVSSAGKNDSREVRVEPEKTAFVSIGGLNISFYFLPQGDGSIQFFFVGAIHLAGVKEAKESGSEKSVEEKISANLANSVLPIYASAWCLRGQKKEECFGVRAVELVSLPSGSTQGSLNVFVPPKPSSEHRFYLFRNWPAHKRSGEYCTGKGGGKCFDWPDTDAPISQDELGVDFASIPAGESVSEGAKDVLSASSKFVLNYLAEKVAEKIDEKAADSSKASAGMGTATKKYAFDYFNDFFDYFASRYEGTRLFSSSSSAEKMADLIISASDEAGVDPAVVAATARHETAFGARLKSLPGQNICGVRTFKRNSKGKIVTCKTREQANPSTKCMAMGINAYKASNDLKTGLRMCALQIKSVLDREKCGNGEQDLQAYLKMRLCYNPQKNEKREAYKKAWSQRILAEAPGGKLEAEQ